MSYINIIVSLCLSLSSCLFSFFITLWQFFVFTSVRTPRQWNFIRSVHWSYLRFKNSSIQNHNVNKKGSLVYFMVADLQRQAIRISFHETWTYQKICLWHNKSLFLMKIQKKNIFPLIVEQVAPSLIHIQSVTIMLCLPNLSAVRSDKCHNWRLSCAFIPITNV